MTPSNSPQLVEQLAQLRDIRLPTEISWWPLAPGWWIALGLIIVLIVAISIFAVLRRRTLKFVALQELKRLRVRTTQTSDINTVATEVGVLLRRVALQTNQDKSLAQVHGETWQSFLSRAPNGMPESIAQVIALAPYTNSTGLAKSSRDNDLSSEALLDATANWIRRHA